MSADHAPAGGAWRTIELCDLVSWLQGRVVAAKSYDCPPDADFHSESVRFADGTFLCVESGYERNYSELTPGGPLDPVCWVYELAGEDAR